MHNDNALNTWYLILCIFKWSSTLVTPSFQITSRKITYIILPRILSWESSRWEPTIEFRFVVKCHTIEMYLCKYSLSHSFSNVIIAQNHSGFVSIVVPLPTITLFLLSLYLSLSMPFLPFEAINVLELIKFSSKFYRAFISTLFETRHRNRKEIIVTWLLLQMLVHALYISLESGLLLALYRRYTPCVYLSIYMHTSVE